MSKIRMAIRVFRMVRQMRRTPPPSVSIGFEWVVPPSALMGPIEDYGNRIIAAVQVIAGEFATRAQNEMRLNAKWIDRTGNARSGLFSMAEMAANDVVTIYLSHGSTVEYGKFLELGNGMRYAIIVPTIQKMLPELEQELKRIFY